MNGEKPTASHLHIKSESNRSFSSRFSSSRRNAYNNPSWDRPRYNPRDVKDAFRQYILEEFNKEDFTLPLRIPLDKVRLHRVQSGPMPPMEELRPMVEELLESSFADDDRELYVAYCQDTTSHTVTQALRPTMGGDLDGPYGHDRIIGVHQGQDYHSHSGWIVIASRSSTRRMFEQEERRPPKKKEGEQDTKKIPRVMMEQGSE